MISIESTMLDYVYKISKNINIATCPDITKVCLKVWDLRRETAAGSAVPVREAQPQPSRCAILFRTLNPQGVGSYSE
jgi:hypothetical protein